MPETTTASACIGGWVVLRGDGCAYAPPEVAEHLPQVGAVEAAPADSVEAAPARGRASLTASLWLMVILAGGFWFWMWWAGSRGGR